MLPSLLKSSVLHIVLAIGLVVSVSFQDNVPEVMQVNLNQENALEAISVDQSAVEKRIKELKKDDVNKKRTEEQRIKNLEKRANEAKKKSQAEARRIKKLEQQRKAKEREKKKAEAATKKAKAKQKVEQDKAAKAKANKEKAEKAAKAAANKRKKEEKALADAQKARKQKAVEEKRKAEAARQKALAEQLLQEQMAQEQAIRAKARQKQILTEVEKYTALIKARIIQNFLKDEKMKGKQCRLNIRLAFNGLVTKAVSLGGDKLVCEAALRSIRMSDTLPVPKDRAVFEQFKNFNFIFKPNF
ncbi:protein TolA [Pseudoalteromonas sp. NBT06-2]|uniref:cell envelope integrity protein TolA n=1 Tax=Pseudoalteromonas sp. NBT06-2 TaxID=2025950 RepID=UPI000BA70B41|nr:cell envelope integrity protein TolA [Pseudoalteromonas sp. NBT06-2]PAJ72808.1 protein TolA [Pseudoalteromonas sp. NBT06-2]